MYRRFRFEHMWLEHPKYERIVRESWLKKGSVECLDEKMAICGADLAQWVNKEFGSIRKKKKQLTELLKECQGGDYQSLMNNKIKKLRKSLIRC